MISTATEMFEIVNKYEHQETLSFNHLLFLFSLMGWLSYMMVWTIDSVELFGLPQEDVKYEGNLHGL
jgi:hypothetical protein